MKKNILLFLNKFLKKNIFFSFQKIFIYDEFKIFSFIFEIFYFVKQR
jgi:hypothetical protein